MFFQIRPLKHLSNLSHIELKIKHTQIFRLYKWKKAQTGLLASFLSPVQFSRSSERKSEIIDRILCWHQYLSCDIFQGEMPGNFWSPYLPIAQHSFINQTLVSANWSAEAHGNCFVYNVFIITILQTGKLRFK